MFCKQAVEALPWYLNDSLNAEEHHQVRGHLEKCTSCRDSLDNAAQSFSLFDSHLPADVLTSYALDGKVADWQEDLILGHLRDCRRCQLELEMVRQSLVAMEQGEMRQEPLKRPGWLAYSGPLAAMLLIAVGLGFWLSTFLAGPPRPAANYVVHDLFPVEHVERAQGQTQLEIGAAGIALTLHCRLAPKAQHYRVEIRDGDNTLWQQTPVMRDQHGNITIVLPADFLIKHQPKRLLLFEQDNQTASEHYILSSK